MSEKSNIDIYVMEPNTDDLAFKPSTDERYLSEIEKLLNDVNELAKNVKNKNSLSRFKLDF